MSKSDQRVIPTFRITNYPRARQFYVEQLGFVVEWEHRFEPHFPVFMSLVRDGMTLYLSEHAGDCQVGGLAHFVIEDVHAWHREFECRNVRFTDPPNNDMGFWNMTVVDPDGNQLRFMEAATAQATE